MNQDKRTYDVSMEIWDKPEPYFVIDGRVRLARYNPWRLGLDDKKQRIHVLASTRESLLAVFPDAIAIGSSSALGKFTTVWGALFVGVISSVCFLYAFYSSVTAFTPNYVSATETLIFGLFAVLFSWWSFRRLFMSVSDWPVVFNRKTRQVTYLPAVIMPFLKFWKSPISKWRTASWDELKVRTYKHLDANAGKSFHDSYDMLLLWGGEGGDPRALRECVGIGYQGYFEDELIWMLWEHIRRYMEEDGSPIQPGETLRPKNRGKPVIYPAELVAAAGGPALSTEVVDKLAEEAVPE